jgi:hypothetical protein
MRLRNHERTGDFDSHFGARPNGSNGLTIAHPVSSVDDAQ